jgi:hypothetical protein
MNGSDLLLASDGGIYHLINLAPATPAQNEIHHTGLQYGDRALGRLRS